MNRKELKANLDKLNKGCITCKARICNFCPKGKKKKELKKTIGKDLSIIEKIKKMLKK